MVPYQGDHRALGVGHHDHLDMPSFQLESLLYVTSQKIDATKEYAKHPRL